MRNASLHQLYLTDVMQHGWEIIKLSGYIVISNPHSYKHMYQSWKLTQQDKSWKYIPSWKKTKIPSSSASQSNQLTVKIESFLLGFGLDLQKIQDLLKNKK